MIERLSNSVFISYRRNVASSWAMLLYQNLNARGIDAFYDIEGITAAGPFDDVIFAEISARPYMIPLLSPGTLDRCVDPGDWYRREVEHALAMNRVLIPARVDGFDLGDIDRFLPQDTAAKIKRLQMEELPAPYFSFAMDRLVGRLQPCAFESPPRSLAVSNAIEDRKVRLGEAPIVSNPTSAARESLERGRAYAQSGDFDAAVDAFTEAIRLAPTSSEAFVERGLVFKQKGDPLTALEDFEEAVALDPNNARPIYNRGLILLWKSDQKAARRDFTTAIRLDPHMGEAYSARAQTRLHGGAKADLTEAIRLNPTDPELYRRRAAERSGDDRIADLSEALRLQPSLEALQRRAEELLAQALGTGVHQRPDLAPEPRRRALLQRAHSDVKQAMKLDPQSAWAARALGRYRFGCATLPEHDDDAESLLTAAMEDFERSRQLGRPGYDFVNEAAAKMVRELDRLAHELSSSTRFPMSPETYQTKRRKILELRPI